MRLPFLLILALALPAICFAAKNRQIGYVQQEAPGELVIISLIETKKKATLIVRDVRKGMVPSDYELGKDEFETLWSAFSGPEAAAFATVPDKNTNMSDVGFYSIKLIAKKKDLWIRIPSESCPETLKQQIGTIQSYIDK